MIKINLLPVRQLKKRAEAKGQLTSMLLVFFCFLLILGLVAMQQINTVNSLNTSISQLEQEKQEYAPTLKKIDEIEAAKKELERKTEVINKLEANSSLTVRILDEIANIVDHERMWLLSVNQTGGSLALSGVALDNQTVAKFMENLKLSPYIQSVNLSDASLKTIAGRKLKGFNLRCAISLPQPSETGQVAGIGN